MEKLLEKYYNYLNNPNDAATIKRWMDSTGKRLNPWRKVSREKVEENQPHLNEEEMDTYARLISYPYHSTFTLMDTRLFFKGLSKEEA
jgi:hypothetical protein